MTDNPPAGIHPLRERLAASDGFNDRLSRLRADRAIIVIFDWLNAEGDRAARDDLFEAAGYLHGLADAIYPKETP